jgi:DNA (cytosine-5)-methyltransferase 1
MSRRTERERATATTRRPTVVDLFSGAGGLSLGCEQAGMDVLASLEYDPIATAVHRFNFPKTEVVCADAATVTGETIRTAATKGWSAHGHSGSWDGVLDAVVGGPPCQGFSLIGKRAFDDPRNQLVFAFARLVGALKPRYFVMENVPGIQSVRAGQSDGAPLLLELLVEEFRAFGYHVNDAAILNAANYGVPQDRARALLVGYLDGQKPPEPAPVQTSSRRRSGVQRPGAEEHLPCPSVAEAIGDLPNLDDYDDSLDGDEIAYDRDQYDGTDTDASNYARILRGLVDDPTDFSYPRVWSSRVLTSSFRTVHAHAVVERYRATPQGRTELISRYFRLHPDGVSPTLRAGTHYERGSFNAPRPVHHVHSRVISVREAARLHSFPDWFRLHWTKWHGFREVGNALPPRLARAVMEQIVAALDVDPTVPATPIELGDRELLYMENVAAAKKFSADISRIPHNAQRSRQTADAYGGVEARR